MLHGAPCAPCSALLPSVRTALLAYSCHAVVTFFFRRALPSCLPQSWGQPGAMPVLLQLRADGNQLGGQLPDRWGLVAREGGSGSVRRRWSRCPEQLSNKCLVRKRFA